MPGQPHSPAFPPKALSPAPEIAPAGHPCSGRGKTDPVLPGLACLLACAALLASPAGAATVENPAKPPADTKDRAAELNQRTIGLAKRMDDLSAETQDLIWNNTETNLTDFLKGIDTAMLDARDLLEQCKTGGETVAAQQDVLEKVYEAAKKAARNSAERQKDQPKEEDGKEPGGKQGQGQGEGEGQKPGKGKGEPEQGKGEPQSGSMDAMLKMMEQMLGITPTEQPGQNGKEGKAGNSPGEGKEGEGKGQGDPLRGAANKPMTAERTVPRASGNPAGLVPPEFRDNMESFRKAIDKLEAEARLPGANPTP